MSAVVVSGSGQGAYFMALPWVREAIHRAVGFEPYPGTLNVRLVDPDALAAWRRIRLGSALTLTPPPTESCGAQLYPVIVAPDVRAAVIVPDVTRYSDDVLELIAPVHLRDHLALGDDARLTLHAPS